MKQILLFGFVSRLCYPIRSWDELIKGSVSETLTAGICARRTCVYKQNVLELNRSHGHLNKKTEAKGENAREASRANRAKVTSRREISARASSVTRAQRRRQFGSMAALAVSLASRALCMLRSALCRLKMWLSTRGTSCGWRLSTWILHLLTISPFLALVSLAGGEWGFPRAVTRQDFKVKVWKYRRPDCHHHALTKTFSRCRRPLRRKCVCKLGNNFDSKMTKQMVM